MKSIFIKTLFKEAPPPAAQGRMVKFDVEDVQIDLVTGSISERILSYLAEAGSPVTAKDIATGIKSNSSRVMRGLTLLGEQQKVTVISIEGCRREYVLR